MSEQEYGPLWNELALKESKKMTDIRHDQIDAFSGKTQHEQREERTQQLAEIQRVYGDNLPYDRIRVTNETHFYMSQSAEAMLEAGKRLVLLKEHEPHGVFQKIVEEELNMPSRTARRLMQASVKFLKIDDSKRQTFADLGRSKLFALMSQDDDELQELAEGGTVAGLTLDEMDKVTVRELKQRLKEAKADQDAVRKVSADKDKKINELSEKLEKAEAKAKREIEKIKLEESDTEHLMKRYKLTLADITGSLDAHINKLNQLYVEASNATLPDSFFREFSSQVATLSESLDLLQADLPSDTTPISTDWIDGEVING